MVFWHQPVTNGTSALFTDGFGNEASSHSKVPHWGKEEEGMHLAWEALK